MRAEVDFPSECDVRRAAQSGQTYPQRRHGQRSCSEDAPDRDRLRVPSSYDRRAMKNKLTVVGLGSSMAKVSRSRAEFASALEGAASAGAETADIRELDLRSPPIADREVHG
jgi:hypothetical protein